jgi:hypothetical protein
MKHRAPILVLLGLGAVVPAVRGEDARTAEPKTPFTGRWALDAAQSDDAEARMKGAIGERRGRGGFMGVPAGRGGGTGPLGGGGSPVGGGPGGAGVAGFNTPPSREQVETMTLAMDEVLHPADELLITQAGVSIEVVQDGDRVLRLYADGRKNKGATGVDKKTRWEGDKLVTESKVAASFGTAVKVTETWAVVDQDPPPTSADGAGAAVESGGRLAITTRLEGGPFEKAVLIRRLYTRNTLP